ncbi:MAG: hypothetical protein M1825_004730 [Sarcosagium campestre]|nr:MAG: hypothetical protein M1825_004730 [Sarcosagium campestre]
MVASGGSTSQRKAPTSSSKLEDQAATAALYVTTNQKVPSKPRGNYPLDEDGKLSAAGAATSLKYAHPHDLPSYPVVGVSNKESSAGAAASLANANHIDFEHWHPDSSASASAAAVLAKDHKGPEIWQPERSNAGLKAANLAQKEGGFVDVWKPGNAIATYGNSAAAQAVRLSGVLSPEIRGDSSAESKKKSLMAATGAMSMSRRRAGSTPVPVAAYPDAEHASANALNAATLAHRPSTKKAPAARQSSNDERPTSFDAARIHNIAKNNVSREMYGSHPPVALEVEEKRHNDVLHAAAISMAKRMFEVQQKQAAAAATDLRRSDSRAAATSVHGRRPSTQGSEDSATAAPMRLTSVEDAARKLAAERLAKLHDEHAAYRDYYGTNVPDRRSSMRSRLRRRASSEGNNAPEDEEKSRRIRSEMSVFNKSIVEVDTKKRQKDRDALLAAAQRNVKASMSGMDEKVFRETGQVGPSLLEEWEVKARAKAEAESKTRMANYGKVDIGGGKFLDQADVDAVAARNVQPLIDDMNEKAELQRAKQEEIRLDQERAKTQAEEDKARQKEVKAELKRAKEMERQEEKQRKAEEKRLAKEQKQRSKEPPTDPSVAVVPATVASPISHESTSESAPAASPTTASPPVAESSTAAVEADEGPSVTPALALVDPTPVSEPVASRPDTSSAIEVDSAYVSPADKTAESADNTTGTSSSTKGAEQKEKDRVRAWLLSKKERFSRRLSKAGTSKTGSGTGGTSTSSNDGDAETDDAVAAAAASSSTARKDKKDSGDKGRLRGKGIRIFGGPTVSGNPPGVVSPTVPAAVGEDGRHTSTSSLEQQQKERPDADSARDVALAGHSRRGGSVSPARSPSPVSSLERNDDDDDKYPVAGADLDDARDTVDESLMPPPPSVGAASSSASRRDSPVRPSRFSEDL